MRSHFRLVMILVAISGAIAVFWFTVLPTTGQQPPASGGFPRTPLHASWMAILT